MKMKSNQTKKRVVSLWLPNFSTDRVENELNHKQKLPKGLLKRKTRNLVLVDYWKDDLRVKEVNQVAEKFDIKVGMTVDNLRTINSTFEIVKFNFAADLKALNLLLELCSRYTPCLGIDPRFSNKISGKSFWLDITASAHLFGGESSMITDLSKHLNSFGFEHSISISDTLGAAWAAARFVKIKLGKIIIWDHRKQVNLLPRLPVSALRLSVKVVKKLHKLGIKKIIDLQKISRIFLSHYFGTEPLLRLDQALGVIDEVITPYKTLPKFRSGINFLNSITEIRFLRTALSKILNDVCRQLKHLHQGAYRFELLLCYDNSKSQSLFIEINSLSCCPDYLYKLFDRKMYSFRFRFGVEFMAVIASDIHMMEPFQKGFEFIGICHKRDKLNLFVNNLSNRLGKNNVLYLRNRACHTPEYASEITPASVPLGIKENAIKRPRPILLLQFPAIIQVIVTMRDGSPATFYWQQNTYQIMEVEGPERIKLKWWCENDNYLGDNSVYIRDYYIIEDSEGVCFWVFRSRSHNLTQDFEWYLHGFFA